MSTAEDFRRAQAKLLHRVGLQTASWFVEVPGMEGPAHVLVAGDGPPVVLVPGFGDPAAIWAPLMARLGGFRLYAVDRPNFGLSGRMRHTTGNFRGQAVAFLSSVLDGLGLRRAPFVANSMGSLWTLWLSLDSPERVAAMSHLGCPALALGTSAPLPMRMLSVPGLGRLMMKAAPPSARQTEAFARMAGVDLRALPELRDLLVVMQRMRGVRSSIRELLRAVLTVRGPRPAMVLSEGDLARIRQQVLWVWGERDPFGGPEVGRRAERATMRGRLEVVPRAGHLPWVDRPEQVVHVVSAFLRQVAPSGAWAAEPFTAPPDGPEPSHLT